MWYWLSTTSFTVAVRIEDGIVKEGPPIVGRFLGQPARSLGKWLSRQPGFSWASID